MIILPSMSKEAMNYFLEILSKRHPDELILLICDGASNHKESALMIPENIIIELLSPRSPQLNPSENMWDEIKEKFFHNQIFKSMKSVTDRLCQSIIHYESKQEIVKSITGWEWIKKGVIIGLKEN